MLHSYNSLVTINHALRSTPSLTRAYLSNQPNQSDTELGRNSEVQPLRHLVLIPTEFEKQLVAPAIDALLHRSVEVQICGIGLIESGIIALELVRTHHPRQAWLVGIAGSYVDELIVGQAYEFSEVCCYGIGVGAGDSYQSVEELGWSSSLGNGMVERIGLIPHTPARSLLSTTAASANSTEVTQKLQKFPDCQAEDMEAFSVARACQSLNVPLRVVRGISNRAGDRQHQRWKVADAMRSAVALVCQQIEEADDHKN